MKIGSTTLNMVINKLVEWHASMGGGASSLAVQLEVLQHSAEGVFAPRDDADKNRSAWTFENGLLSRMDFAPLWKDLTDQERHVLVLRNSPREFQAYNERVINENLREDDRVVSEARDDQGQLIGWNVARLGMVTWDWPDIAAKLGTSERDIKAINRRAFAKIRKAIERSWDIEAAK